MDLLTIAVIGIIVILILGVLLFGAVTVANLIVNNLILFLLVAVVGMIFFGIWYFLIRKQQVSVSALMWKQLMDSCLAGSDQFLGDLSVAGNERGNGKYLGNIRGKISMPLVHQKGGTWTIMEKDGVKMSAKEGAVEQKAVAHVIAWRQPGFLKSLFNTTELLWLFDFDGEKPCHTPWVGDVDVHCDSVRKVGRFWFLGSQVNHEVVDQVVALEALRISSNLALDHMHDIMVRSLNANPDLEAKKRAQSQLPFNLLNQPRQPDVAAPIQ